MGAPAPPSLLGTTRLPISSCNPLTLCSHIRPPLLYRTLKNCQCFTLRSPINYSGSWKHTYSPRTFPRVFLCLRNTTEQGAAEVLLSVFVPMCRRPSLGKSGGTLLVPHCNVSLLCSQTPGTPNSPAALWTCHFHTMRPPSASIPTGWGPPAAILPAPAFQRLHIAGRAGGAAVPPGCKRDGSFTQGTETSGGAER